MFEKNDVGDPVLSGKGIGCAILCILVVVAAVIGGCTSIKRVDPGNVGILVDYGRAGTSVSQPWIEEIPTGSFRLINPVMQRIWEYPVAQQTLSMQFGAEPGSPNDDSVKCQDKNGVQLNIDSSVLWRVNPEEASMLYLKRPNVPLNTNDANDIETQVVRREVRNAITNSCSFYTYDELFTATRLEFGQIVADALGKNINEEHIVIDKFLVGEIHLPESYAQAIDSKAKAQQAAQEAAFLIEKAQNEAKANIAEAEGQKQVAILKAEAQAKAIQIINDQLSSVSPSYIQYLYSQKWDGAMPSVLVLSNGQAFPLIAPFLGESGAQSLTGPQAAAKGEVGH